MRWFGKDWGAPVCRDCEQGPRPATENCIFCNQKIGFTSDGLLLPDGHTGIESPAHLDCMLDSIGHNVTKQVFKRAEKENRIQ